MAILFGSAYFNAESANSRVDAAENTCFSNLKRGEKLKLHQIHRTFESNSKYFAKVIILDHFFFKVIKLCCTNTRDCLFHAFAHMAPTFIMILIHCQGYGWLSSLRSLCGKLFGSRLSCTALFLLSLNSC